MRLSAIFCLMLLIFLESSCTTVVQKQMEVPVDSVMVKVLYCQKHDSYFFYDEEQIKCEELPTGVQRNIIQDVVRGRYPSSTIQKIVQVEDRSGDLVTPVYQQFCVFLEQ